MSITSGFFDSLDGDRLYDADQLSTYFEGLISDGVYESIGEKFLVTSANDGMNINVQSGRAIIKSHWVKNDGTEVLTLDPASAQQNRVDAIVLRYDAAARSISLAVKKGTESAGTPALPAISRTENVYELYLASVLVNRGASQPTSITDLRPSSYCGWVTGIIKQVDTSDLFTQYETAYANYYAESTAAFDAYMATKMAAFNAWFATLTSQLDVGAGVLKESYRIHTSGGADYPIPIRGFDPDNDILLLFIDGIYKDSPYDYIISKYDLPVIYGEVGELWYHITLNSAIGAADLTFVVLRNTVGKDVVLSSSDVQAVSNGGIAADIIATASQEV